jgi:transcriptional regulator with XRE-family HTH domain
MGNIIKANISYWMTFLGMSHKEVAAAMNMSNATLYNRMRLPSSFTIAELERFAGKIGIEMSDLVVKKA